MAGAGKDLLEVDIVQSEAFVARTDCALNGRGLRCAERPRRGLRLPIELAPILIGQLETSTAPLAAKHTILFEQAAAKRRRQNWWLSYL